MKVKVGDQVFNSVDEPILLVLDEQDKKNIASMEEGFVKYCSYPSDKVTEEEAEAFMQTI